MPVTNNAACIFPCFASSKPGQCFRYDMDVWLYTGGKFASHEYLCNLLHEMKLVVFIDTASHSFNIVLVLSINNVGVSYQRTFFAFNRTKPTKLEVLLLGKFILLSIKNL